MDYQNLIINNQSVTDLLQEALLSIGFEQTATEFTRKDFEQTYRVVNEHSFYPDFASGFYVSNFNCISETENVNCVVVRLQNEKLGTIKYFLVKDTRKNFEKYFETVELLRLVKKVVFSIRKKEVSVSAVEERKSFKFAVKLLLLIILAQENFYDSIDNETVLAEKATKILLDLSKNLF